MRRGATSVLAAALLALALASPAAAQESFGLKNLDVSLEEEGGSAATLAGSHPHAFTTTIDVNTTEDPELGEIPVDAVKDLQIALPPGLLADRGAVEPCPAAVFLDSADSQDFSTDPFCPNETVLGMTTVKVGTTEPGDFDIPVYNMVAPRGAVLKLGFIALGVPVTIEAGLNTSPPYNGVVSVTNIPQVINFYGSETTIWGVPADESHDAERGTCLTSAEEDSCSVGGTGKPFLTLPRSCTGPLTTTFRARSWQDPGNWLTESVESPGMDDCASLSFGPVIEARMSSDRVSSPSGLAFDLDVFDEGLTDPEGRAKSDILGSEVALPTGVTINPSQAEGLGVCSEAQIASEGPGTAFGAGCPAASKIGSVEAESPLLADEVLHGSLFVAEPYENPFDSLIALYIAIKDPELGVFVSQPLKVAPDPRTGRLISTTEEMPQVPLSHVRLRFREGGRSALITPPGCGSFETTASFTPWSDPASSTSESSSFSIDRGLNGGPCPSGQAPFRPGFEAGTLNNQAGAYSPFSMRLTRGDGEQDMIRFSAVLPPGVLGRIAGIPWCPEAGIARAKSRTGKNGGSEERRDPSCPAASAVGRTVAGAGVGSQLTYVPGALYLAGPYNGAPLSVVSITPALAGPFDAGTVVVRVALRLNPKTARVEVDGAASDPIPHFLQGIPLNVRDLRVFTDRPSFTLNATSCERSQALATLWGGGTALAPNSVGSPVGLGAPYQAAGCRALGFEPKVAIKLRGGTRRGANPALRAVVTPRPGDANFSRAAVTLPTSAFIDQSHFRTICTRVQFAAGPGHGALCPKGARYGWARAWSPLLDAPAQGPVYLRSSNNKLPDLVIALRGPASAPVEVELAARIDSVKGGLRSIFAGIPDVPVSRFILDMQGGKKGLFVNSRHLCHKPGRNRAKANLVGQNGTLNRIKPVVRAVKCAKAKRSAHRSKAGARAKVSN